MAAAAKTPMINKQKPKTDQDMSLRESGKGTVRANKKAVKIDSFATTIKARLKFEKVGEMKFDTKAEANAKSIARESKCMRRGSLIWG